jgi:hypothetical protein
VRPSGPLSDEDIATVRAALADAVAETTEVKGLLIDAAAFPGYEDFAAFTAHVDMVRRYHSRIAKVAFVSDAAFASAAEMFAQTVLGIEARHFSADDRDRALAWLED